MLTDYETDPFKGALRNRLKPGPFLVLAVSKRQDWPLRGSLESLGIEGLKQTTPTAVIGCILSAGQDAKRKSVRRDNRHEAEDATVSRGLATRSASSFAPRYREVPGEA